MQCPQCEHENAPGRKFCAACGQALAVRCGHCGVDNTPGDQFCGECGAALGSTAAAAQPRARAGGAAARIGVSAAVSPDEVPEGERKTVTALFADIKGSMELMEDLDPEEARRIVDPALQFMMEAVHRYEGYVAQSTGDGIFALFGAPVAREDHPQRALHAALRMQQEMRRYAARLRAAGTPPIEARVGVNTGEVVVRTLATGEGHVEYTPIGHSTSLAARLQTLAVLGKEFALSLVRAVSGRGDDELNRMLGELQLAEFIYEQPAAGEVEYTFKHALTQEVAYHSVLSERRKLVHEHAAAAIEGLGPGRVEDQLMEVAHHYSRSGNVGKAVEYLGGRDSERPGRRRMARRSAI
jgi:class 3 adenylate cyclase